MNLFITSSVDIWDECSLYLLCIDNSSPTFLKVALDKLCINVRSLFTPIFLSFPLFFPFFTLWSIIQDSHLLFSSQQSYKTFFQVWLHPLFKVDILQKVDFMYQSGQLNKVHIHFLFSCWEREFKDLKTPI